MTAKAQYLWEKAQYLSIFDREPTYHNSAVGTIKEFTIHQQIQYQLTGSGHVLTWYPLWSRLQKKIEGLGQKIYCSNFFVFWNYELKFG